MKLIVISAPGHMMGEKDTLFQLFEKGLEHFHLRKPGFGTEELQNWLNRWPIELREKTVVHKDAATAVKYKLKGLHLGSDQAFLDTDFYSGLQQSKSFHSFEEIRNDIAAYSYRFISPVFNSISKEGYKSAFVNRDLESFVKNYDGELYALGGIDSKTALEAKRIGFKGIAVLGTLWGKIMQAKLMAEFDRLMEICNGT